MKQMGEREKLGRSLGKFEGGEERLLDKTIQGINNNPQALSE